MFARYWKAIAAALSAGAASAIAVASGGFGDGGGREWLVAIAVAFVSGVVTYFSPANAQEPSGGYTIDPDPGEQ